MKNLTIAIILTLLISSVCLAKEYKVELDDKYVVYFEEAFIKEDFTPEEWLSMQALNLADQSINQDYIQKNITGKTRDQKISDI